MFTNNWKEDGGKYSFNETEVEEGEFWEHVKTKYNFNFKVISSLVTIASSNVKFVSGIVYY